jgi:hypothetical protein
LVVAHASQRHPAKSASATPEPAALKPEAEGQRVQQSSATRLRLARTEELEKRLDIIAVRPDRHFIDCKPPKQMLPRFLLLIDLFLVIGTNALRARVDLERLVRLRINKSRETDIGQLALARILNRYRNYIVTLSKNL